MGNFGVPKAGGWGQMLIALRNALTLSEHAEVDHTGIPGVGGGGGTSLHANLTDVSANQHHNKFETTDHEIIDHSGIPGVGGLPSGIICMWSGLLANIPNGWFLCDGDNGTPDLQDRFIIGVAQGINPGGTGGSNTHSHNNHAITQPNDHAALVHAGATVGDHSALAHSVTQPSAHSDHGALSHSAHTGVSVDDHASHTHAYTQIVTHVHRQQYNPTTTGAGSGPTTAPDTSSSGTTSWGTVDTQAPSGSVASGTTAGPGATITHTVNQPSAHSDHGAQSHSAHTGTDVAQHGAQSHTVGQSNNHAAQSHAGTNVDAHSSSNNLPLYFALAFIMKS